MSNKHVQEPTAWVNLNSYKSRPVATSKLWAGARGSGPLRMACVLTKGRHPCLENPCFKM